MKRLLVCGLVLAAGCSDALEQDTTAGQVVAVVNTDPATLSLVSASSFSATTLDLMNAAGRPATLAGRVSVLAVPLPGVDSIVFLDFGSSGAGVALSARVENLFDRRYEEARHFPARGRTILVGAQVELGP